MLFQQLRLHFVKSSIRFSVKFNSHETQPKRITRSGRNHERLTYKILRSTPKRCSPPSSLKKQFISPRGATFPGEIGRFPRQAGMPSRNDDVERVHACTGFNEKYPATVPRKVPLVCSTCQKSLRISGISSSRHHGL